MTVSQLAQRAAVRLRVRSALNPILWLSAITCPVFIGAAWLFRDHQVLSAVFAIVALLPVLVACGAFIGFAIVRPEKLQSEEYQLRHEALQLIQEKTGRKVLDVSVISAITNPTGGLLGPGDPRP